MTESRVRIKVKELEGYFRELEEMVAHGWDEFTKSLMLRRAIERELQIMIECVVDICYIITSELKLGPPSDDENVIDLLSGRLKSIRKVKLMKGFRNILVHKYGNVDDARLFKYASQNATDFEEFIKDVRDLSGAAEKQK